MSYEAEVWPWMKIWLDLKLSKKGRSKGRKGSTWNHLSLATVDVEALIKHKVDFKASFLPSPEFKNDNTCTKVEW